MRCCHGNGLKQKIDNKNISVISIHTAKSLHGKLREKLIKFLFLTWAL